MADIITIDECIQRLDVIRHEIVPDSRDHFALSAGIVALYEMDAGSFSANHWFSCDEKLPDDGQICIVKRKFSYKVPCPYMIGVWSSDRNMFSGIRLGTNLEDAISWMPFIDPDIATQ